MKTKRYLSLNHEMCERAVLEAFDKKWFRRDYLATETCEQTVHITKDMIS